MLQQTLDRLEQMRLFGMAQALKEQASQPEIVDLSFEERLQILVDRESDLRDNRRLSRRLKEAKLKQQACVEDVDFRYPRGLDRSLLFSLANGQWLRARHNVIITGPTGVGKSFLACALGNNACRLGFSTRYWRTSRILQAIAIARADGTYNSLTQKMQKTNLLILDDWGLAALQISEARDLLDILEDRNQTGSTLISTQLPVSEWHTILADPTLADAILDRLVHNAYRIELRGESMRKRLSALPS